tara:strand:- start:1669 stop:1932 length:264 start_codon:yes stop_codon:yes gene_type:complete
MEKDLNIILNNFLDSNQPLIDSEFKERIEPIRIEYLQEIGRPGCTPCIVNAAKRKFSERIKNVFEQKQEQREDDSTFDPFADNVPSP